ncbi:dipeptidyl-peptidase 3 family protein [Crocinitomix algicola]|uniref:dipeptidyl-peptidase 3 family protein n=1 Tax=Crocinitomix algicola TaxID=1740263 RepID=UPI00082C6537|nr:dihydrofolate reductase [Crocinitomix algicola]
MKNLIISGIVLGGLFTSCGGAEQENQNADSNNTDSLTVNESKKMDTERFGDVEVLRYEIPGFEKLSLTQKKLVYYLYEAGLSGRDIIWDQNYRYNLEIRNALEHIVKNYNGDKNTEEWGHLMTYTKRMWFSNGIHHHYSMDKFQPEFSRTYLEELIASTGASLRPEILEAIFDNSADKKRVSLDDSEDLILNSATNFYGPTVTEKDVENFYKEKLANAGTRPVEIGLNSQLTKDENGNLVENVWKTDGMYGAAITKVVEWLKLAQGVAENEAQGNALGLLIEYYETGDLNKWAEYNIAWSQATEGDIDYIQGFVEVYGDPVGMRGSYESIIQINDFEASERMAVMAENAQWFEDHSSIQEEHKKANVVGVSYKVVNVAGEAGDASPSTPIGVNLPNSNWIRAEHGSKSVSLGNIVQAYENAGGEGILREFAHDDEEIERAISYGKLASKMHTAMHEVIGHASGKINEGVGTPKETLKNYSSTLEEARADLVALYFLLDEKLIDLGLIETLEVGKAEYDSYIRNGLMVQMRRLEPGANIEEAHMRNRQLVAAWAFEKGAEQNVIEKVEKAGKTYFNINDYEKLRVIFGDLLREIQRIKSEGDFAAGKNLVENYGVKVDQDVHNEVLERSDALDIAPYYGFMNPILTAVKDENGEITDVTISQPTNFETQMLDYSYQYGFLGK